MPAALRKRIASVTRERYHLGLGEFKRQRAGVIAELRDRGVPDAHIAKMLGVTVQYLARVFHKRKEQS